MTASNKLDRIADSLTPQRLREGLGADELRLVYQPKVNMRSGRVVGAEALLRWQHPEHGEIAPYLFLPLAERDDLIVEVGTWVLRTALRELANWRELGIDLTVSVNIAPRQLLHPDFLTTLQQCLADEPDAHPARLELEILESAALDNTGLVRELIETCRDWGVSFALDDFGTGYSSLSYLRQIPANVLKIDQSFVRDLLEDEDARNLVEGVIGLAQAFRREVVAEGVEESAQGALLMRLGCDVAQGYGIARPMPPARLPQWIVDYKPDPDWQAWVDVPWDMQDLPLLAARFDHCAYVNQVLGYLTGGELNLARSELEDHRQCRFGRWYYHEGQARYGHMPEFLAIEEVHRHLHEVGTEAVAHKERGEDFADSADGLRTIREEMGSRLRSLQLRTGSRAVYRQSIVQRAMPTASRLAAGLSGAQPIRILIVDDAPSNIELLAGALARDYTVIFATSGEKALELAARPDRPDLILLDIEMPGMDGYETCRRLKDEPATRDIPVIFVTASTGIEEQIRGFSLGGVDFITKPVQIPIVQARVRIHLNLKLRAELLEQQAALDGLTGIANRRQWNEVYAREWRRARREHLPISVLMIDTDHFKDFNDYYGHGAGDDCLRQISSVLSMALRRPGDFIARYGGEEFSVILPGCGLDDARAQAERMRGLVQALHIPHAMSSAAATVTVSIGCACTLPQEDEGYQQLLEEADRALYAAKSAGRNRVICTGAPRETRPGDAGRERPV